jgi:hypothetical protein
VSLDLLNIVIYIQEKDELALCETLLEKLILRKRGTVPEYIHLKISLT